MRKMLAELFLIAVCASNAFGWGEEGHRIVCRIAYDTLSVDDRKEVDRLTKAYKTPPGTKLVITAYPDACIFPDEARVQVRDAVKANGTNSPWLHFEEFNDWHFVNVKRSVQTIPAAACAGDCVLTGIAKHSGMLKSGATDQERAEGLIFLGHWVGDIHQPLHVSYADDQGGNTIKPITGGYFPKPKTYDLNLHAVWDGGMIRKAIGQSGWRVFADALQKKITAEQKAKWEASAPLEWAQESYEITTLPDVQYCQKDNAGCESFGSGRKLGKAYQDEFLDDVELRLQMAGVRLAALIHGRLNP